MQWAGAANIEGGVTIDLSALNQVTVTNALLVDGTETKHGTVVNLGPGWVDTMPYLQHYSSSFLLLSTGRSWFSLCSALVGKLLTFILVVRSGVMSIPSLIR